jgi:acyl-coenzyme A synthetase/AMP-(fatty) acid ligase
MSVLAPFLHQCAERPDALALISAAGERISFAELDAKATRLARAYRARGIGKGDRVLIALGLGPALYTALIALWRLGAVAVAPEASAGLQGLAHAVRTTRPKAYIGPRWLAVLLWSLPGVSSLGWSLPLTAAGAVDEPVGALPPGHPALISFTSGSTGEPKAIVRSHGFLIGQLEALTPLLTMAAGPALVSLPMFVLAMLALGATSILPPGSLKRPAAIDAGLWRRHIDATRAERLLAPPAICLRLAEAGALGRFQWIATGGGPIFPTDVRTLQANAPDADIVCVYGSTEAEPIAHVRAAEIDAADWAAMRSGGGLLAGTPVPDVRLRFVDDEILVTGPHVNTTWTTADRPPDKREIDGEVWHATGDAGRLDERGRLWLLGRLAGRIGGYFPFAVEAAARGWPGVRQAGLIGIDGQPMLALAGDHAAASSWLSAGAEQFPGVRIVRLPALPMDRRHNSKIDYRRLAEAVRSKLQ